MFEGQYLTYAEYKNLGGSEIGETPFNLLEFEARKKIDARTQRRLIGQTIPNEVKICEKNLIDTIILYDTENNRGLNSETVGSYSVSYNDIEKVISDKSTELDNIIIDYLYGVIVNDEHLIYSGV